MQWFHDLKLAKKLTLAFSVVTAITLVIGVIGVRSLRSIDDKYSLMYKQTARPISQAGALAKTFQRTRVNLRDAVMASSADEVRPFTDRVVELSRTSDSLAAEFEKSPAPEEAKRTFEAYAEARREYAPIQERVVSLARENRDAEAMAALRSGMSVSRSAEMALDKLQGQMLDGSQVISDENTAYTSSVVRLLMIVVAVGVITGVVIALWLARLISTSVMTVAARVEQLRSVCVTNLQNGLISFARGQLNVKAEYGTPLLDVKSKDEVGQLSEAVNGIVRQAAAAIEAFNQASATLTDVVGQTHGLIQAAQQGKLDTRGDAAKFQGGYRELVDGTNQMLDAVVRPMREASETLKRAADRDLTARMTGEHQGEMHDLKAAVNTALDNLDRAMAQVAATAGQVAAAASQISAGSQSLAQGTTEQAASLEEISASLQELASMSKQMAGNAREMQSLAEGAKASAGRGSQGMGRMTEAVGKIQGSAAETAKIVKTIDEIAFQTNLLALNAAVEAARAGDAGKGFAVVAEEVRNLAMRSAEAAKQTAALIEESVKNAGEGVAINREAIENFREIDAQVNKVGEVIAEVSAATDQQAQGVGQITTGTEQLNQVTQHNAAGSQESAAAAEELTAQAAQLAELVGGFQLTHGAPASRSAAPSGRARPAAPPPRKSAAPVAWARKGEKANDGAKAHAGKANGHGHAGSPRLDAESLIPFDGGEDGGLQDF